jgi:hypothetical protein
MSYRYCPSPRSMSDGWPSDFREWSAIVNRASSAVPSPLLPLLVLWAPRRLCRNS